MMMEIKQEQFDGDENDKGHSEVTTYGCDKRLLYLRHLMKDRPVHSEERNFECKVCGSVFNLKGDLRRHTKVMHSADKEMVKCDEYRKSFPSQTDLTNQAKVHSGDMTEIKQERFDCDQKDGEHTSENSTSHTQSLVPEIFNCGKCMEVFTCKTKLHQHVLDHSGVTTYECEECDKKFFYQSDFRRHRFTHSKTNDFSCKDCGLFFFSENRLQCHMSVHTGEKKFECEECGKKFRRKANLKRHKIVHTGSKTVCCIYCGKIFQNRSQYASHVKQVHSKNSGNFTCDECGANFESKFAITQHVLTHLS